MATVDGLPKKLADIQIKLIRAIDELSDEIEAGNITPAQWDRLMGEIVARGSAEAMAAGQGEGLTAVDSGILSRFINEQLAFLENFKTDIIKNGWIPAYRARAQMYASSTTTPFNFGDVIRQAGRPIPVPSLPAEGTICHTNCKCKWKIDTIDSDKGDYNCYWLLGTNDNCQTCVQRAADWSPVKIRGLEIV